MKWEPAEAGRVPTLTIQNAWQGCQTQAGVCKITYHPSTRILFQREWRCMAKEPTRILPAVMEPDEIIDSGVEQYTGITGPKIRCPQCSWKPKKEDTWACGECGHSWHTFETCGISPNCMHFWTTTQCLKCDKWSAHSAWHEY